MGRHSTAADREAALALIDSGETQSSVARKFGVTSSAVRNWRAQRSGVRPRPAAPPPAAPPAFAAPVAPIASPPVAAPSTAAPSGLEAALATIEAGAAAAAPGAAAAQPGAPGAAPAEKLGPETLVGLIEGLRGAVVVLAASRSTLTPEELKPLETLGDPQRKVLLAFAPYATDDVCAIMDKYPRAMGYVFLGLCGFTVFDGFRQVRAMAAEKAAREEQAA
jgi:transposase-like protein